jgi:hypothetical protein
MKTIRDRRRAYLGTAIWALVFGAWVSANPIIVDFTEHGSGDFDQSFFAASGIVFTQGTLVGFVQGDEALVGSNQHPIAGNFLTPVTSLSVTVALSLQTVTDFTLTAYDADPVPISTTTFRLNQDTGSPGFMGFGYFTISLDSIPEPAFSFRLTNQFVSSSFGHTNSPYGASTFTFTQAEAPCTYAFSSGGGGSSVKYCVSANGTIEGFRAPTGQEHIAVGQLLEGYVVCTGTTAQAWDLSATADGFGAPTVLSGPTATGITLRRSSPQYQLDQVFKLDKKEKDVTITMTLTNISGAMIPDVRLTRAYDPDINNDFGDDLEVKSARGVWAGDVDAITLTGVTWGLPTDTAIDADPVAACSPVGGIVPGVTGDARLAAVTYCVGNMAPGAKKKVAFIYRMQ